MNSLQDKSFKLLFMPDLCLYSQIGLISFFFLYIFKIPRLEEKKFGSEHLYSDWHIVSFSKMDQRLNQRYKREEPVSWT